MIVFTLKKNLKEFIRELKRKGKNIGFVPTMGALHEGHLSLIERSLEENDHTVVSIFVNPTQFDNRTDLEKYPRFLERDLHKLELRDKDMIVYIPDAADLYNGEIRAKKFDHGGLDQVMEGKFRPGHFDGVATVVKLLFESVEPDRAYFGEKDFQQLRIIQNLVKQFNIPVEICPVPIFREEDGLAMSSRNLRLTPEMRKVAPVLYKALMHAEKLADQGKNPVKIRYEIEKLLSASPLELEYFEIADEENLLPVEDFEPEKNYRAFIAAYVGDIRLIDNIRIK